MVKAALKVVESPSFYTKEVELWAADSQSSHSLHYSVPYPETFPAELPAYFISKYTRRGDVVLDPFCGSGTTALEAALQGRIPCASDSNPLAVMITQAKLFPADITEVTLWLQLVNLSRPVALEQYRQVFSPFFDIDTFREILNLRALVLDRDDKTSRFIGACALALLHGHTAGYLSAYSFPQVSLSPAEQEKLNIKRSQVPEYRAVAPRILRKAAMLGRDGVPSILSQMATHGKLHVRDARDLSYLTSASVDLVVTAPPLPCLHDYLPDMWLRLWFAGVGADDVKRRISICNSLDEWLEFMNEFLFELARVVRSGGRAVLDLREILAGGVPVCLDDALVSMVSSDLGRYWEAEVSFIQRPPVAKLRNGLKERDDNRLRNSNRMLVLRRR